MNLADVLRRLGVVDVHVHQRDAAVLEERHLEHNGGAAEGKREGPESPPATNKNVRDLVRVTFCSATPSFTTRTTTNSAQRQTTHRRGWLAGTSKHLAGGRRYIERRNAPRSLFNARKKSLSHASLEGLIVIGRQFNPELN